VAQDLIGDSATADKAAAAVLDEFLQNPALLLLPAWRWGMEEGLSLLIEIVPELFQHRFPESFQPGDRLALRVPLSGIFVHAALELRILPDALLERLQPIVGVLAVRIVPVAVNRRYIGRHFIVGQWLAEIEAAAASLAGHFEDAVFDFQGGDALAGHIALEIGLCGCGGQAFLRGDPAVAVTDQRNKKGPAALDFAEADLEDQQLLGLLLVEADGLDAPAQVDGLKAVAPIPELLHELGKDLIAQIIALFLHVAKGGGNEDGTGVPKLGGGHENSPNLNGRAGSNSM